MKRIMPAVFALFGLIFLVALGFGIAASVGGLSQDRITPPAQTPTSAIPLSFQSPFDSPIQTPTLPPSSATVIPTMASTGMPPSVTPTPWHPTPRPTPVRPAGPTPTAIPPIPPKTDASGELVFVKEQGPGQRALFRLAVNGQGNPATGGAIALPLGSLRWSAIKWAGLYPAPRGSLLALVQPGTSDESALAITVVDVAARRILPFYEGLRNTPNTGRFGGWHPDGRHFLYNDLERDSGLWLLDANGAEAPRLLLPYSVDAAAISPSGQALAYAGRRWSATTNQPASVENGIWLARADGSDERKVLDFNQGEGVAQIAWSPDGSRLAYVYGAQLWVIQADGTGAHLVSSHWATGWGFDPPAWSPNSQMIAFPALEVPVNSADDFSESGAFGHVGVHLVDVSAKVERVLLTGETTGSIYPAWSPDGSWLAFLSNRGGNSQIWAARSDGARLMQMTTGNAWYGRPIWIATEAN